MKPLILFLAIAFVAAGCGDSEPRTPAGSDPAARRPGAAAASAPAVAAPVVLHAGFVDRRAGSGVDFVNHSGRPGVKEWIHESKGGSALVLDYDGDGRMDLYFVDGNVCVVDDEGRVRDRTAYRNLAGELGELYFEDVSERSGLSTGDFEKTCWGTKFADLDRDGYLDLFIAAGHVYPEVDRIVKEHGATYRQRPSLWRNSGPPDFRFEDVSVSLGGPEMEVPRVIRGACFADLDDDGDVDVVLYALNGPPVLFENRIPTTGGFFQLALAGRPPNRDALGAKVTLVAAGGRIRQLQEMRVTASFLGTNDPRLHWGLGPAKKVDRLEVEWPDGTKQTFENLAANHLFRLEEGGKIEVLR